MVRFQTAFWRNRTVNKTPEDLAGDTDDTLIFADAYAELDNLSLGVPAGVLGEAKEHCPLLDPGRCLD